MSKPSDGNILRAIEAGVGQTVLPTIHYRQALALEAIAESLKAIEANLTHPLLAVDDDTAPVAHEPEPRVVDQGTVTVGPATQHRRRRSAPEAP